MDFTQDVILDLLPLYLAGEASPGTRAVVDQYLQDHPEIAERVRQASNEPLNLQPAPSPSPDLEMRTFRRTMSLLNWRHRLAIIGTWLTGISLMVVISFRQGHPHIHFLMQDYPGQLSACALLALQCWIYYFIVRRRLNIKPPN